MTERDPAIEPIRGDIVRSAFETIGERRVTAVVPSGVTYYIVTPRSSRLASCRHVTWKEWCRRNRVTIIQRGDGERSAQQKTEQK